MSLLVQALKTVGLVVFYYCFSISLTFYNKWILTVGCRSSVLACIVFNGHSVFIFTRTGLSLPALHHYDSPHSEISHCLDTEEAYLSRCGEAPTRFGLEGVLEERHSSWYVHPVRGGEGGRA